MVVNKIWPSVANNTDFTGNTLVFVVVDDSSHSTDLNAVSARPGELANETFHIQILIDSNIVLTK